MSKILENALKVVNREKLLEWGGFTFSFPNFSKPKRINMDKLKKVMAVGGSSIVGIGLLRKLIYNQAKLNKCAVYKNPVQIYKCKADVAQEITTALEINKKKCSETSNPIRCMRKHDSYIEKMQKKKEKFLTKVEKYKERGY